MSVCIRKSSLERIEKGLPGTRLQDLDEYDLWTRDFYIHGDIPDMHVGHFKHKCKGQYNTHIVDTPVYRDDGKLLKLKILSGVETDEIFITVVES
jgi:hypothetical protein